MGITVKEALSIGGLKQCKVVAGHSGLDRIIDHVTVMEVPDVIRWLKGNDLLLTSLYPIKDDQGAIQRIVQELFSIGASALAIKTNSYVQEIPIVIVEAGDKWGLPIIHIDKEVSYLDIMTPIMETTLNKKDSGKDSLESMFQWITELAMSGKGISALIEAAQQVTENLITVESEVPLLDFPYANIESATLTRNQKQELKTAKRSIRVERRLDAHILPCIVTPILINDELYGWVTCWQTNRAFIERDIHVLDRLVPLLALEFLKVITRLDVEQVYKNEFLSEILHGNVTDQIEAVERGNIFGWDLAKNYQVLSISFVYGEKAGVQENTLDATWQQEWKRKLLRKVYDIFKFSDQKVIVTIKRGHIILLYPRENQRHTEHAGPYRNDPYTETVTHMAESVRKLLANEFIEASFMVGIGRFYSGISGIHKGYKESLQALKLGRPILQEGNMCIHYESLGIFRILSQFHDMKELEDIYAETVGKLVEYDELNGANLVSTLTEYFNHHCVLSDTAEQLFVHVNTMKYRLQKIESLTGCKIHDAEKRLMLHIGLKIHQIKTFHTL